MKRCARVKVEGNRSKNKYMRMLEDDTIRCALLSVDAKVRI
jgi:hypothetical protein